MPKSILRRRFGFWEAATLLNILPKDFLENGAEGVVQFERLAASGEYVSVSVEECRDELSLGDPMAYYSTLTAVHGFEVTQDELERILSGVSDRAKKKRKTRSDKVESDKKHLEFLKMIIALADPNELFYTNGDIKNGKLVQLAIEQHTKLKSKGTTDFDLLADSPLDKFITANKEELQRQKKNNV